MRNRRGSAAGMPESGVTAGRGRECAVDVGAQEVAAKSPVEEAQEVAAGGSVDVGAQKVAAKSPVRKNRLGGCGGGAGGRPKSPVRKNPNANNHTPLLSSQIIIFGNCECTLLPLIEKENYKKEIAMNF